MISENETALRAEIVRLNKVVNALMNQIERSANAQGTEFSLLQTTLMLDEQVRARTADLEAALSKNEQITHALRLSEAKYRAVTDQSLVGISVIEDGRFSYTNLCFSEIFGYDANEVQNLHPLDLFVPDERPKVAELFRKRLAGELDRVHYQAQCQRKSGEPIKVEVSGTTAEVKGKQLLVSVIQDITERSRTERELETLQNKLLEQSICDALTGLYNRRYLEDALIRELRLAERHKYSVSLIMGDLDHFKQVNDHHGHQAGDEVLRNFACLLSRSSRSSDINCRYGGEEFLLIMPHMTLKDAAERAEQLRVAVAASRFESYDLPLSVTASFGVATYPENGQTMDELITAADRALYTAKGAGRNRVVMASTIFSSENG